MGLRQVVVLLCALGSGCVVANFTPTSRFQDAAYTLNDAARWGQVDNATKFVSPTYLDAFVSRHREWGGPISIADADLVRMKLADDRKTATSEVALNWYDTGGVTVRNSVITQQWEAVHGNFRLVSETIRAGDTRIFAQEEAATSGASTVQ
ncbi:MAG: hypothetical protein QM778_25735 [Myxococcales bacterium]